MIQLPGIDHPLNATAVVLRGPAPSRILGLAAMQQTVENPVGTLTLSANGGNYSLNGAASVSYHVRQSMRRHGEPILSISYEDRRWKWRFACVSGLFNERLPDCTIKYSPTHPGYRRNARQLFSYVLSAAGSDGDVSDVPTNIYPRCVWQDERCDAALEYLCDVCRCTIVLDANDQIKVVREGVGQALQNGQITHPRSTMRIGALPDSFAIGCAPTRFQSKFLLQAVGLDVDGAIRPIDQLSYAPAEGWSGDYPGAFPGVAEKYRHLAIRTVWRWYRIKAQASGGLNIPECPEPVQSIDQYELDNWLVDVGQDQDQMPRPLPAYLQGSYYPQNDLPANTVSKDYLPAPFTILPQLNIVEFAYPVWYVEDGYYEPSLYLTTSYRLKKADGTGYVRYARKQLCAHPPAGTQDFIIPHPELWKTHVVRYSNNDTGVSGVEDNMNVILPEIQQYLALHEPVWSNRTATDACYSGVMDPGVDGMREQAVIDCGHDVLPTTRIGQMIEHDIFTEDKRHRP